MPKYQPHSIEPKWQAHWDEHHTFRTPELDLSKPKFYVLDMFPYPSGAGLHVGHPEGYTATDIMARYKRARGFNVLHPMGWDAFGLPAEQYAIQTGTHPAVTTAANIANFKRQLKALGFSYDWSHEVDTTDPKYYRWTQWIFLQLYKKGLAYMDEAPVNWCPALGTVLSNEEVINGRSERGNHPVVRRPLKQWMLAITKYADRLLADLEGLDWPDAIKDMQRNWIGRSEGAEIDFQILGREERIRVYTTRPDTLFGATYMVMSPEHKLVGAITTPDRLAEVEAYQRKAAAKSDLERTELDKSKTGVFTGAYALNPANNEPIPIWLADYVLATYGTGAIMAVPGHDIRDWEFAKAFDLPIVEVISGGDIADRAHTGTGCAVNSGFLNGLEVKAAKEAMIHWLEESGKGQRKVNYKLRDWLFSRQRYWGEPFPVSFDEEGTIYTVPETELPLLLPDLEDFHPPQTETPQPPLSKASDWVTFTGPDGKTYRREVNTMPQWAGSCWYYLRFIDPRNDSEAWSKEKENYWMPVDLYVGGAEHAVLHLLYARFWHKVLYDLGYVSTVEPFQKLVNQGLITSFSFKDNQDRYIHNDLVDFDGGKALHKESGEELQFQIEKMSKSKGNVINPDSILENYGADSFRLYEMFMGPLEMSKPWNTKSIDGVRRFLERCWRLVLLDEDDGMQAFKEGYGEGEILKLYHQTVRGVTDDLEQMRFNTAISKMMILVNGLTKEDPKPRAAVEGLLILLSPFAPHLAEELWSTLGHKHSISHEPWPCYDEERCKENIIRVVVQVNGKKRADFDVPADADSQTVLAKAKEDERVNHWIQGKELLKEVYIPGKLVNFVVKG